MHSVGNPKGLRNGWLAYPTLNVLILESYLTPICIWGSCLRKSVTWKMSNNASTSSFEKSLRMDISLPKSLSSEKRMTYSSFVLPFTRALTLYPHSWFLVCLWLQGPHIWGHVPPFPLHSHWCCIKLVLSPGIWDRWLLRLAEVNFLRPFHNSDWPFILDRWSLYDRQGEDELLREYKFAL